MKKKIKFWRGQPKLPNFVWDESLNKGRGGVIADFSEKGFIITDDPAVIEKLKLLNYPEVSLDSTTPPFIPEVIQPPMKDVPIKKVQEPLIANDSIDKEKIKLPINGEAKTKPEEVIGGENEYGSQISKLKKIARR